MSAVNTLQVSPFQVAGKTIGWSLRFAVMVVLYFIFLPSEDGLVAPYLPTTPADLGPVPEMTALLIICVATVLVVMGMIHSSRWNGWKLIVSMSVACYLLMTLVTQLEAWYFLLGITVGPELVDSSVPARDPHCVRFHPDRCPGDGAHPPSCRGNCFATVSNMSFKEWLRKLGVIYLAYLVLYYTAGYFIAWQNPEVRAFYGSPGAARPFFQQMAYIFANDPGNSLSAAANIRSGLPGHTQSRGSRLSLWQTALIVGLALSVPQNIGHILPNSLIPLNSVRMSHLIETASSTFVFGFIMTWLLYPKYTSKKSYSG